jgi:hypothetical protein
VTVAFPLVTGLRRAARLPGPAVLLWLVNLLLAAIVVAPFWLRLNGVLAGAPGGDRLLDGSSFGLLADLAREYGGLLGPLVLNVLPLFGVMLLVNALAAGGVLEVLIGGRPGGWLERFGGGALRLFGRFLRVEVLAGVVMAIATGAILGVTAAATRNVAESEWEPATLVGWLAGLAVAGLALLAVLLALDLARVRIVREGRRRVMRAFFGSLWLVFRHPLATVGLWLSVAALFGVVLALYFAVRALVPAVTWPGIALMVVAQQVVVLARAVLRVGLYSAEVELVERFLPPAPVAPSDPFVDEPPLELVAPELPLAE